jgi:hypothetical protein
MPEIVLDLP